MGTPPENEIRDIKAAIAEIANLLGYAVEGVARTGAFEQAASVGAVRASLDRVYAAVATLGHDEARGSLRGAAERVENKIHIRRLWPES